MGKSINLQKKLNSFTVYFLCFVACTLFCLFNFEVPLVIYKLITSGRLSMLLKHINFYNILNILHFFIGVIVVSIFLFIISGFIAIFIFMFQLDKIYEIFYAFNNVNNIVLFAPTFIFLVHTYNITKYGLFFILVFDTTSNMVVLIYEFFNIELKDKLLMMKQFHKNAKPIFKYLLYMFFSKFKSIMPIYFTEIIDNAHMYAFIIKAPVFLSIIENITRETSICNEFILGYFIVQMLTYTIFIIFYILF